MGANTDPHHTGASRVQGMTEQVGTQTPVKHDTWRKTVGVACAIGIVAAIALGIGLTWGVTLWLQIGFATAAIAVVVALAGGYDHFFNGD